MSADLLDYDAFLADWESRCEVRPVRLDGGPFDGEVTEVKFTPSGFGDEELVPPIDGLCRLQGMCPGDVIHAYYGPIRERDGEWIRPHASTAPVAHVPADA